MEDIFSLLWPILTTAAIITSSGYWFSTRESLRYNKNRYFKKWLGRDDFCLERVDGLLNEGLPNTTFRLSHMKEIFLLSVLSEELIVYTKPSHYEAMTLAEFLRHTKNNDSQRVNDTFGYYNSCELEDTFVRMVWEGYRTFEIIPKTKKLTPISKEVKVIGEPYFQKKEELILEDKQNTPTYNKTNIHSALNIPYVGIWDDFFYLWQGSQSLKYTDLDKTIKVFPYGANLSKTLKLGDALVESSTVSTFFNKEERNQIKREAMNGEKVIRLEKPLPIVEEKTVDKNQTDPIESEPNFTVGESSPTEESPGVTSRLDYAEHDRLFSSVPVDQWREVRNDYKEYLHKFLEYETDPWLAISYPAFNDVSVTDVSKMIKAMKSVERFFSMKELKEIDENIAKRSTKLPERSVYREYSNAVDEFIIAFKLAEKTARQITDTNMSTQERSLLKTAKGLLRHAEDPGNPEKTRKNYYVQLKRVIDKLNKDDETVIPLQITAQIEQRAQLKIENNQIYINVDEKEKVF